MSSKFEKMYLISEQEYNMRIIQPHVEMPTYKTPDMKAEEHSFKILGSKYENKANQLYKEILKYSHVNDRNEWYEKRDDTLPIAGSNIVDLISYAVKSGIKDKPYSWSTFVEFLKSHKGIPHVLLTDRVKQELNEPQEVVPLLAAASPPPPPQPETPVPPILQPALEGGSPKPLRHAPVLSPAPGTGKHSKTQQQNKRYVKNLAKRITQQTGTGL